MSPVDYPTDAPLEPGWSNDEAVRAEEPPPERDRDRGDRGEPEELEAGFSNARASRVETPEEPAPEEPMEIGWSNARAVRNPEHPDNSLPGDRPARPDQGLPGDRPVRPDNSLPPTAQPKTPHPTERPRADGDD